MDTDMTDRVAFEDLMFNTDGTLNQRAKVQNAGWTDEEVAIVRAQRMQAPVPEGLPEGDTVEPHTLTVDEMPSYDASAAKGEMAGHPLQPVEITPIEDLPPKPLPGYKEIGEGIVDHLLKTYPTAGPLDWRRMQSGMQYANRLGGTWSKKTRG